MKNFKKLCKLNTALVLSSVFSIFSLASCSSRTAKDFNTFEEINRIKPIIATNETLDVDAKIMELMPDCELVYYSEITSGLTNLKNGKVDGVVTSDFLVNESLQNENFNLKVFEEDVQTYNVGLGLSDTCSIPNFVNRVNEIIDQFQADGTMENMNRNWNYPDSPHIMPTFETKPGAYTIQCVTFGQQKPVSYWEGTTLKGFDVEFAYRVADALDCNVNITTAEYPSMLLGLASGKYDMISANLYITEQRDQNFTFSRSYTQSKVQMLVNDPNALEYKSLKSLEGKKKFSILTGGAYIQNVQERYPECEILHSNTVGDAILALTTGKIDAFFHDGPVAKFIANSNEKLGVIDEHLFEEDYYFLTSKSSFGRTLKDEFNEWLVTYKSSGRQQEHFDFWTSNEKAIKFDYNSLPATKGTINVGYFFDARPASYVFENETTGYPNQVIYEFCKDVGYKPVMKSESTDGFIAALQTNKVDIMTGLISFRDDRAESVDYTDVIASGGVSAVVRKAGTLKSSNGFKSIIEGFKKTFVDEDRYKMVFKGLGVTLLISVCAFILANAIGAGFAALSMSKSKFAKAISSVYQYIIQGTPVVVILMILYYIIFGKARVSGEFVAIIGFALVSGAGLAQQFKGGIESVDKGQKEASLALGFTRTQTFKGIVLPQMVRRILPGYFAELIALVKSTSIVGYISVIDLTKTGDIIRSATFEAFFPLIAVAIFYFVIVALLLMTMQLIQKSLGKELPKNKEGK